MPGINKKSEDEEISGLIIFGLLVVALIVAFGVGYLTGHQEGKEDFNNQKADIKLSRVNYTVEYMDEPAIDEYKITTEMDRSSRLKFHVAEYHLLDALKTKIAEDYNVKKSHVQINSYRIEKVVIHYE